MSETYVRRGLICVFLGIFFMFLVVITPQLSPLRAMLIIPSGAFLTLALNYYLKSKEEDGSSK